MFFFFVLNFCKQKKDIKSYLYVLIQIVYCNADIAAAFPQLDVVVAGQLKDKPEIDDPTAVEIQGINQLGLLAGAQRLVPLDHLFSPHDILQFTKRTRHVRVDESEIGQVEGVLLAQEPSVERQTEW